MALALAAYSRLSSEGASILVHRLAGVLPKTTRGSVMHTLPGTAPESARISSAYISGDGSRKCKNKQCKESCPQCIRTAQNESPLVPKAVCTQSCRQLTPCRSTVNATRERCRLSAAVQHIAGCLQEAVAIHQQHRADICIHGHSHKFAQAQCGPVFFLNPGSAGPARFKLGRSAAIMQLQPKVTLFISSSSDRLDWGLGDTIWTLCKLAHSQ